MRGVQCRGAKNKDIHKNKNEDKFSGRGRPEVGYADVCLLVGGEGGESVCGTAAARLWT